MRTCWLPYHQRLERELASIYRKYGIAILFDCHSILSQVPRLFEGKLPDFNVGTAHGGACHPGLLLRLAEALGNYGEERLVVDGRFTGGFITRHYGDPDNRIHSFQLELSMANYCGELPPWNYAPDKAAEVRPALRAMAGGGAHLGAGARPVNRLCGVGEAVAHHERAVLHDRPARVEAGRIGQFARAADVPQGKAGHLARFQRSDPVLKAKRTRRVARSPRPAPLPGSCGTRCRPCSSSEAGR